MNYEVQFQHEGAEYIVRGPDIDGVLRLIQGVQGVGRVPEFAWVEWSGGDRPVDPDQRVEIECRDGSLSCMSARYCDWVHLGDHCSDIVRYRVCA